MDQRSGIGWYLVKVSEDRDIRKLVCILAGVLLIWLALAWPVQGYVFTWQNPGQVYEWSSATEVAYVYSDTFRFDGDGYMLVSYPTNYWAFSTISTGGSYGVGWYTSELQQIIWIPVMASTPNSRVEFKREDVSGTVHLRRYTNGVMDYDFGVMTTVPYYWRVSSNQVDDFIIGTNEEHNIIGAPPQTWFVAKDVFDPGFSGLYSAPNTQVYASVLHASYGSDDGSGIITVVPVNGGSAVCSTVISNYAGVLTFNLTQMLFNSGAPYGQYKISMDGTGAYDTFWYKGVATTGTSSIWNNSTYTDDETAIIIENIAAAHWVPASYKYYCRVQDSGLNTIEQWEITSRPVNVNQTTTITQAKYPLAGTYYATIYAVDRSSDEDILLCYDDAYFDLTWSEEGLVSVEGTTYDAVTGSPLGSCTVTATQAGSGHSTTSNAYDGSYSISALNPYQNLGINCSRAGYVGYPVYFYPYTAGTYSVDLLLVPAGGAAPGAWVNITGGQATVITHSNTTVSYYNSTEDGTAIGGITYLAPYWTAGEGVNCTLSNSTWSSSQVCDNGGWYQFDNLEPTSSYTLCCSNTGWKTVTKSCALNEGCFNRQDAYLSSDYSLTVNIKDLDSGALLAGSTITVELSTGASTTTTTGTAVFSDVPYGVIDIDTAALGYYPGVGSVVIDGSKSTTVYMQVKPDTPTAAPTVPGGGGFYNAHQVRFVVQDNYGRPLPGVAITATAIESSTPWDWIEKLFGINQTEVDIQGTTLTGTTGIDGSWTSIMMESVKYQMTFVNATLGINTQRELYPKEEEYTIWIRLREKIEPTEYPDYAVYAVETDPDTVTVNMAYHDTALATTSLTFKVMAENGTVIHTDTWTPVTTEWTNTSWTLPGTKGAQYTYGLDATHPDYGTIKSWKAITIKGSELLVDFGLEDQTWYQWFAVMILIGFAGSFHAKKVKLGVVAVPLIGGGWFWYIGWLPWTLGGLISLAGGLGILLYIRKQEYKVAR